MNPFLPKNLKLIICLAILSAIISVVNAYEKFEFCDEEKEKDDRLVLLRDKVCETAENSKARKMQSPGKMPRKGKRMIAVE